MESIADMQGNQDGLFQEFKLSSTRQWSTKIIVAPDIFKKKLFLSAIPPSAKGAPHYLITDFNVDPLFGDLVLNAFIEQGFDVKKLIIPPNELSKSMVRYVELLDEILKLGLTKKTHLISLGGGVVNNIAGFLASTIYRGLHLVHIATTTLSQVDAAIDFKQAVNAKYGKNLVGAMYPADQVFIDPSCLSSLPDRDFYNGLSESLKHALAQSPSFFNFLIKNSLKARNTDVLTETIKKTIALKLEIMNDHDPTLKEEMIKQYGHSIGHAVEHLSRGKLLHGEAIAIGMCVSAEIAKHQGICNEETVLQHIELFSRFQLPTRVPSEFSLESICEVIKYDKHFVDGRSSMLLLNSIGDPHASSPALGYDKVDFNSICEGIKINKARI